MSVSLSLQSHSTASMPRGVKPFSEAQKRAAIELWKAKTPLKRIREELKDEIRKLWVLRMDDSPYLKKLVESMPDRIQEVIQRDRNVTHY